MTCTCLAAYPGPTHPARKWAWFPLFAHARNLPEILVNRVLPCYIRDVMFGYEPLTFRVTSKGSACSDVFAK